MALNLQTSPGLKIFQATASTVEEARLCVFLINHENSYLKDYVGDEVLNKIADLSKAILLVENPEDISKYKQIKAECWEDPSLIEQLGKRKNQFEVLLEATKNLFSLTYPLDTKMKAIRCILKNAKTLKLEIENLDEETIKSQLENISKYETTLKANQRQLAECLQQIHSNYLQQTVIETYPKRQTRLISYLETSLAKYDKVLLFCGPSHADLEKSVDHKETERFVKFIHSLSDPYIIYACDGKVNKPIAC